MQVNKARSLQGQSQVGIPQPETLQTKIQSRMVHLHAKSSLPPAGQTEVNYSAPLAYQHRARR